MIEQDYLVLGVITLGLLAIYLLNYKLGVPRRRAKAELKKKLRVVRGGKEL